MLCQRSKYKIFLKKPDPIVSVIRQSLFGQGAVIGEENEDGDASVYNVELEEQDLHDLDDDFAEINCSIGAESDTDKSPEKTPTNKGNTGTFTMV